MDTTGLGGLVVVVASVAVSAAIITAIITAIVTGTGEGEVDLLLALGGGTSSGGRRRGGRRGRRSGGDLDLEDLLLLGDGDKVCTKAGLNGGELNLGGLDALDALLVLAEGQSLILDLGLGLGGVALGLSTLCSLSVNGGLHVDLGLNTIGGDFGVFSPVVASGSLFLLRAFFFCGLERGDRGEKERKKRERVGKNEKGDRGEEG